MLIGHSYRDLKKSESFYKPHLLNRTKVWVGRKHTDQPGVHPLTAQALKHHLASGSFSILTAHNPNGEAATPERNAQRNQQLEAELKRHGAIYHHAIGTYKGHQEASFLVHHTTQVHPEKLSALANHYGQESILHSSQGSHRLEYLRGENMGKHHPGKGHKLKVKGDSTQIEGQPKSKFSLKLEPTPVTKSSKRKVKPGKGVFIIPTEDGDHQVDFNLDDELSDTE